MLAGKTYRKLVEEGSLSFDENQIQAIKMLDKIGSSLLELEKNNSSLAGFFRNRKSVPKGLYIYGSVGCGKTLIMDIFYNSIAIKAKRRVHFHEFMDEIHQAIADFRKQNNSKKGARDPIVHIIKPIIKEVRLLCFDEFHVTDITNAMILQRLFEKLFHAGIVVIATSNIEPDNLYKDGLNRQLFLPFISLLKQYVDIYHMHSDKDYRQENLRDKKMFFFGQGEKAKRAMDEIFTRLSGGQKGERAIITNLNRKIIIPKQGGGVARFSFADLCEKPLSSRDYLKIARQFSTIIVENIPDFSKTSPSAIKRFILMIDVFYDHSTKLAANFTTPLDKLIVDNDNKFEFKRTISRLKEMNSAKYIGTKREIGLN